MAVTMAAMFFFMIGMALPFNYALLQAKATGVSPNLIPYLLSILNAVRCAFNLPFYITPQHINLLVDIDTLQTLPLLT